MEGTISHLDVLRCGISNRPMTAQGQTPTTRSAPACLLPPNADIAMFADRAAHWGRARPAGLSWKPKRARRADLATSRGLCAVVSEKPQDLRTARGAQRGPMTTPGHTRRTTLQRATKQVRGRTPPCEKRGPTGSRRVGGDWTNGATPVADGIPQTVGQTRTATPNLRRKNAACANFHRYVVEADARDLSRAQSVL
jgi:hypothetical protein